MPIYTVGIMSDKQTVKAPSAAAAALFYGIHTNGDAQLMAVVYTEDGKEIGETPWLQYGLGNPNDDDLMNEFNAELRRVWPELAECQFMPADGDQ